MMLTTRTPSLSLLDKVRVYFELKGKRKLGKEITSEIGKSQKSEQNDRLTNNILRNMITKHKLTDNVTNEFFQILSCGTTALTAHYVSAE